MSTWAEHDDPNASIAGFRMSEPDPDHSSLHCPCGSTFTWSGLDAGLEVWIKEHTPHQEEKK